MDLLKFPENLKKVLIVNHISQQALADKLKTTQATVSRWLNESMNPIFQNAFGNLRLSGRNAELVIGL